MKPKLVEEKTEKEEKAAERTIEEIDLVKLHKIQGDVENARLRLELFVQSIRQKYNLSATDAIDLATGCVQKAE